MAYSQLKKNNNKQIPFRNTDMSLGITELLSYHLPADTQAQTKHIPHISSKLSADTQTMHTSTGDACMGGNKVPC